MQYSMGEKREINIAEWFDDIDILVDNSEKLVFSAYLEKMMGRELGKPRGKQMHSG